MNNVSPNQDGGVIKTIIAFGLKQIRYRNLEFS